MVLTPSRWTSACGTRANKASSLDSLSDYRTGRRGSGSGSEPLTSRQRRHLRAWDGVGHRSAGDRAPPRQPVEDAGLDLAELGPQLPGDGAEAPQLFGDLGRQILSALRGRHAARLLA